MSSTMDRMGKNRLFKPSTRFFNGLYVNTLFFNKKGSLFLIIRIAPYEYSMDMVLLYHHDKGQYI